jgi:hypothetical protein
MITWTYDDGEPYYMSAIDKWTERTRPCWRASILDLRDAQAVQAWIDANFTGDWETNMRFNSGNPFFSVVIYTQEDATAFQLRWL